MTACFAALVSSTVHPAGIGLSRSTKQAQLCARICCSILYLVSSQSQPWPICFFTYGNFKLGFKALLTSAGGFGVSATTEYGVLINWSWPLNGWSCSAFSASISSDHSFSVNNVFYYYLRILLMFYFLFVL